jgi:hypothetical protein
LWSVTSSRGRALLPLPLVVVVVVVVVRDVKARKPDTPAPL